MIIKCTPTTLKIFVAILGLLPITQVHGQNNVPLPDHQLPVWSKLVFGAAKFGLSASAEITIDTKAASDITKQLVTTQTHAGLLPLSDQVTLLKLDSTLAGQAIRYSTWFEAPSGRMLQIIRSRAILGRHEKKTFRFAEGGVWQIKMKNDHETSEFIPLIHRNQDFSHLSQPIFLFYLISSSRKLNQPGDTIELPIYTNKSAYMLKLHVEKNISVSTQYTQPNKALPSVKRTVEALKINVNSFALDPKHQAHTVSLAGLDDGLVFYLEKGTRIPLELQGEMGMFGTIRYILQQATITHPSP